MEDSNKSNCNSDLVGKWRTRPVSYGIYNEITDECLMYFVVTNPYTFPDKNTLLYEGRTYHRVTGDPYTLIGVWKNDSNGDKLAFFEDGTFVQSSYSDDLEDLWSFTATETHLTARQLRATLKIDGSNITHTLLPDTVKNGTFEIVSSEKWIARFDGGEVWTYYRE